MADLSETMPEPTCWVLGPDTQAAIPVRFSIGTTVGQLEQAECKLTHWTPSHGEVISTTSQMPIATHELLQSEQCNCISVGPSAKSEHRRNPLPTTPVETGISPAIAQLVAEASPIVSTMNQYLSIRADNIMTKQRAHLAAARGPIWADDEMHFHLHIIAQHACEQHRILVLDPLITTTAYMSMTP